MTNFTGAFAEASIQRSVQDEAASDPRSNEHTQDIASALGRAGLELAVDSGIHIVLEYCWTAELFGNPGTKRKVLEVKIRCFNYAASIKVDRARSADANRREMILIYGGFFESPMSGLSDGMENLFIVAPPSCLGASARNDISITVQHSRQNLGSTKVYTQNV